MSSPLLAELEPDILSEVLIVSRLGSSGAPDSREQKCSSLFGSKINGLVNMVPDWGAP